MSDRALPPTAWATVGPFFPSHLAPAGANDLTRRAPDASPAQGQPVLLSGRVIQEDRSGVGNFLVEIWQADANGRFDHPADRRNSPVDRNFAFWGRAITDADGRYSFRTVKPGLVPAAADGQAAPHIALTLLGSGIMRRLTTRLYFPDDPHNGADPLLRRIADEAVRDRLIARRAASQGDALALSFDIVLRGPDETPFFED